jgi:hypothetical protein
MYAACAVMEASALPDPDTMQLPPGEYALTRRLSDASEEEDTAEWDLDL